MILLSRRRNHARPTTRPPASPAVRRSAFLGLIASALIGLSAAAEAREPITLRDMGSFHVGGREVTLSGLPVENVVLVPGSPPSRIDPNNSYWVEAMYAQYFLPANRRGAYPLLLWHGGGLSGVSFETTPDGREGWKNQFVRLGWDTYVSDSVERGRAGFARFPEIFTTSPIYRPRREAWEAFRIGTGANSWSPNPAERKQLEGNQFPAEGYDNFVKQLVPRWTSTDDAIQRGYDALLERVCPCVIVFHSQAGLFAFRAAQKRPDLVKALVAVETSGIGAAEEAGKLKDIPLLMVYGDHIVGHPRWPAIKKRGTDFADLIKAAGGKVDIVDLPDVGVRGNSHMLMMDKNNLAVAQVIQDWLAKQGLWK
jgi:pimeloyl-ACP methyl ester carboxylesterase